jgi:hypothetical protein
MKSGFLLVAGSVAVVAGSFFVLRAGAPPSVAIALTANGLSSIKSGDIEFLENGDFRVDSVLLKDASGKKRDGSTTAARSFDAKAQELSLTFPWGTVKTHYEAIGNRVQLTIDAKNTSATDTIQGIHFTPLTLKFPDKVVEYDGSIPLLAHNIGQVAAVKVSWSSGTMAVVSDDIQKPVMVGFPWALNRPANTEYPLSIHTDRVGNYPDSYPTVVRPIPPRGSDRFAVSLRLGRKKATEASLAADAYKNFAAAFPAQLQWADRRPVGAIFLATGPQEATMNPRGWFGDPKLNVSSEAGHADFRQRILNLADGAIGVMRDMNAQGAITWDIEGQEFRHATTYIGDPRLVDTLAPEMADVADEYFRRIKDAGFRTGICVRPQLLKLSADKKKAEQTAVADTASLLIEKIGYARKRWGITLVYLDSNVDEEHNPLDASVIQKVAAAFPDCLIIPEHSNLRYYAYSAPFGELRHGTVTTPDTTRDVYPKAFTLVYTADGPLDQYRDGLKAAVRRGDALMYRTWFTDPQNEKVKAIYAR